MKIKTVVDKPKAECLTPEIAQARKEVREAERQLNLRGLEIDEQILKYDKEK